MCGEQNAVYVNLNLINGSWSGEKYIYIYIYIYIGVWIWTVFPKTSALCSKSKVHRLWEFMTFGGMSFIQ